MLYILEKWLWVGWDLTCVKKDSLGGHEKQLLYVTVQHFFLLPVISTHWQQIYFEMICGPQWKTGACSEYNLTESASVSVDFPFLSLTFFKLKTLLTLWFHSLRANLLSVGNTVAILFRFEQYYSQIKFCPINHLQCGFHHWTVQELKYNNWVLCHLLNHWWCFVGWSLCCLSLPMNVTVLGQNWCFCWRFVVQWKNMYG